MHPDPDGNTVLRTCPNCGRQKLVRGQTKHPNKHCSECRKVLFVNKRTRKIDISCYCCHKTISIRRSRVQRSHYYLCGKCVKLYGSSPLDPVQKPGQILVRKMQAAGEMNGFDIRYPTPDEAASLERARLLRDHGIAWLQREERINEGEEPRHHHLN